MDKSLVRTNLWSDIASTTNSEHVTTNYNRLNAMPARSMLVFRCSL